MHKNYKLDKFSNLMKGFGKKGQIGIFVILALVIVGIIIVFLIFRNANIRIGEAFTPESFLRGCIEDEIKPTMNLLSKQGGYTNPEGFMLFNNSKVKFLCYTYEFYKTCMVQQPNIKAQYEKELNNAIKTKVNKCASDLRAEYERRGFGVSASSGSSSSEFVPKSLKVKIDMPMTVTKDSSQTFKGFDILIESSMYELLMTANSIIDFESTYGDSETTLYMQYYPNLRIEKIKFSDGSKIYRIADVVTKEQFTFASRSLSWPPGYGLES